MDRYCDDSWRTQPSCDEWPIVRESRVHETRDPLLQETERPAAAVLAGRQAVDREAKRRGGLDENRRLLS